MKGAPLLVVADALNRLSSQAGGDHLFLIYLCPIVLSSEEVPREVDEEQQQQLHDVDEKKEGDQPCLAQVSAGFPRLVLDCWYQRLTHDPLFD